MPIAAPGLVVTPQALPQPRQLAALGTVLCLYRPQHGGELSGWARAVRAESHTDVDSDGLRESLAFFDDGGYCCWRLYLLPDSDFLAWDHLLASLRPSDDKDAASGVGERLWRRLAGRLLGGQWQVCELRLHAVPAAIAQPVLAASLAAVSPLGVATARRIAQAESAEESIRVDDCCCARSSLAAAQAASRFSAAGTNALPLVRLTPRKKA
ncbi:MAG TPA: Hemin transport protein [Pseudoxanthomonas sp.]